jgi:phosphatidylserine decarboxylase
MPLQPIQYYNRYTGRVESEVIYGGAWLRWTYGSPLGRLALHLLVKRAAFSRWYGWRMDSPRSRFRILPFMRDYGISRDELLDPPESYGSFNEFFYRRLKPSARPVDGSPDSAVFPADGRHLGFATLDGCEGILVKGEVFDLADLLQNGELARAYRQGSLVISRLCPVDYHRFHFPVAGTPGPAAMIEGPLFSVNPIALRQDIRILARNRRWITEIESPSFGRVLMIEVGATNVGSAISTYAAGQPVAKGAEKGFFKFGGSLTMCLFQPDRLQLSDDLLQRTAEGLELYARMGDRMGMAI